MFRSVCERLDAWIGEENDRRFDEGGARLGPCSIKLFGQAALLERSAEFSFPIAATKDVDVFANFDDEVEKKFAELVKRSGWVLDPLGHESWMPKETKWEEIYQGSLVRGFIAEADFVLLAKALKAPEKNRPLLTEFIAAGASERFLDLARKYKVDLEALLK